MTAVNFKIKILFVLLLGGIILFAQNDSPAERYKKAYEFERKADYESAEQIYRELHEAYPQNYNYFIRYKYVLSRQRKLELLVPLLEGALKARSYDVYMRIELGVLYFSRDRKEEALTQWRLAFRGKNNNIFNNYALHVYRTINDYGLNNLLLPAIDELRSLTDIPDLLARYAFVNQVNYRDWPRALEELRLLIKGDEREFTQAKAALFDLDTSLAIFDMIPEALENMRENESRIFLSDYYLYLGRSDSAVAVLSKDTANAALIGAMQDLAQRLHRSGEFINAAAAASHVAKYGKNTAAANAMRLLAAKSEMDAYFRQKEKLSIIPQPYPSVLGEIPFPSFKKADRSLIERAMAGFDALASSDGPLAAEASYYRAEILFSVLQDVDGALAEFGKLAAAAPADKKIRILARIADCYQARGEFDKAKDFLTNAPENYRLMAHEEDLLSPYLLRAEFLSEGADSLRQQAQNTLALLPENDNLYNDVIAYAALVSKAEQDSVRHDQWLDAERLLVRNKIAEAAEIYYRLIETGGNAPALYAMRYLDCLTILGKTEDEGEFWESFFSELKNGNSGDYFMLRYAEYQEKIKNHKKAVEIYEEYLLSYQESMYYEMIRQYLRNK